MSDVFRIKLEGIDRALRKFSPRIVRSAARETINRTIVHGRSVASKLITSEYNVKTRDVNSYLVIESRAQDSKLEAVIRGRGLGLALSKFDAKQTGKFIIHTGKGKERRGHLGSTYGRGYPGPVTVKVKKAEGRKQVASEDGYKPFLARMKSGHIGVWRRTGRKMQSNKKRDEIVQMLGPGIGGLFGSKRIRERTIKAINERFKPEFKRQLVFYLSRVG